MSLDHSYHPLRVKRIVQETRDTKSFVFDIPPDQRDDFAYEAGQFCTFHVGFGDDELFRCYSMSSSPHTGDDFTVTVKRVPGGRVSNWMNDAVGEGDVLAKDAVLLPEGDLPLTIGNRPANDRRFDGVLDEVRIERGIRSPEWIATGSPFSAAASKMGR